MSIAGLSSDQNENLTNENKSFHVFVNNKKLKDAKTPGRSRAFEKTLFPIL